MHSSLQHAFATTALTALSLYVWRLGYVYTDWAALALAPLMLVIGGGFWPLTLEPWRATLRVALRENSPLGKTLTGRLRALSISGIFTCIAVTLLAWQALSASAIDASISLVAFFLSSCLFATGQSFLIQHFHQPFARSIATSLVTWIIALPFTLIIAFSTWAWARIPGEMLDAGLQEAMQIGLENLPERGGWITAILAIPYAYEASKLWIVIQLPDYPIVAALFSIDAALFSFVLCRSAAVMTQFTGTHFLKART